MAVSAEASSFSWTPGRIAGYRARRAVCEKLSQFLMEVGAVLIISNGRGMHGTYFTSNGASYAADAKPSLPRLEMAAEHYACMLRLLQA